MLIRVVITVALILFGLVSYGILRALHHHRLQQAASAHQSPRAGDQPRLLYFCSDHCAPCLTQAKVLEQLPAALAQQVAIEQVDVERERETAAHFSIFTVPTTLLLDRKGQVRHVNYGLTHSRKLIYQMENLL